MHKYDKVFNALWEHVDGEPQYDALLAVLRERFRQDEVLHRSGDNPNSVWLSIVMEEVGEIARAVRDEHFGTNDPKMYSRESLAQNMRTEAVQACALLLAWIEWMDKREIALKTKNV